MERRDPDAELPEIEPTEVLKGVEYARRYLRHVLWNRYQMEGMPEQAGMRYAIDLLEHLENGLRSSVRD
jgi:hypothetical protein